MSFCSPFSPVEFLAAVFNLSSSITSGLDKVAYPMLKHLPRSGMDFLLHIFNLSWSLHFFRSICRHLLLFQSARQKSFSTLLLPSGCRVSRLELYRAAMPKIFLSVFYIFFVSLLSASQHLTPAVVCDSSFYYVYSCIIIVCV